MYETFENLPESKREHILQICIEEFAKNGYASASTNTIVKRLGISKGVLFLYFKNKKSLFLYIADYITMKLTDLFFEQFSAQKPMEFIDIFDHMAEFYRILLRENPYNVMFLLEAFLNAPDEVRDEIEEKHELAHEQLMDRMTVTNLREGVDIRRVLDLVHRCSYYVGQMMFKEYDGREEYFRENSDRYLQILNQYLDIIKHGVYK